MTSVKPMRNTPWQASYPATPARVRSTGPGTPRRLRLVCRQAIPSCMSTADSPQTGSLEESILDVLTRAGAHTLSAPEIAHAIAPEGDWHGLLMPIRRAAVALAQAGRLVIYRKGKPADPNDFRGVYRLGLPRQD